jgi:hypothetical protein
VAQGGGGQAGHQGETEAREEAVLEGRFGLPRPAVENRFGRPSTLIQSSLVCEDEEVRERRQTESETKRKNSTDDKEAAKQKSESKEKAPESKPPAQFRPAFRFLGGSKAKETKESKAPSTSDRAENVKKVSE